jgi:hypothetical protein
LTYIGRSIIACTGTSMKGLVTGKSHHEDGTHWHMALENGKTSAFLSLV